LTDVCLAFEVHQPFRIDKNFTEELADGKDPEELLEVYFNDTWNREILLRAAEKCYRPANRIILENIDLFKSDRRKFKVAFSISGVFLEQCKRWAPDVIDSFNQLAETECVEFLCQTYYHSLASLYSASRPEFVEQVLLHRELMEDLFRQKPKIFENTEFIYNDSIAKTVAGLGFLGIFTEGTERMLKWRSPNFLYRARDSDLRVLLRNYRLSDDVSFRFSNRSWVNWPLTADMYAEWLSMTPGQCINIFMDYETFGEHQWPETGIHDFLRWLPGEILRHEHLQFKTPSELVKHKPVGEFAVEDFRTISWADTDRSTEAWLGNDMQRTAYTAVKGYESLVKKTNIAALLKIWRLLQISDHIYYMYTTTGSSGIVHGYFSQQFPTEAFWSFLRVVSNFHEKVSENLDGEDRVSARLLRYVPPDRAFHFHENGIYLNISAHSLEELRDALPLITDKSILFHSACKHFEKWIRFTIGDRKLADSISEIDAEDVLTLRQRLNRTIAERTNNLRKAIG
jgi:alpha-amylase